MKIDYKKKFVARLFQCFWNLIFRQPFRTVRFRSFFSEVDLWDYVLISG